jgi:hypothetical protein
MQNPLNLADYSILLAAAGTGAKPFPGFLAVLAPIAANVYCSGGNLAGSPYSAASSRSPASVALFFVAD